MIVKFSVCVDALYMGKDLYRGMQEIKESGIKNIEFWTWWDKDIEKLRAQKDRLGLDVKAFCTKFISLVDPALRNDYIRGLEETLKVAKQLNCKTIISQVGNDTGTSRREQHTSLAAGLRECAPILEAEGVTLVIEPLNLRVDHAGYYLSNSNEAFEIINETESTNVKILFDIYHQQITEGDVTRRLLKDIDKIGHFHAAGNPGRHELVHSELNYDYILKEIDSTLYRGVIGLEYFPLADPRKELMRLVKMEKEGAV